MKRTLAIMLVMVLVLSSFAACGGGGDGGEGEAAAYDAENPMVFRLASDAPVDHMSTRLNEQLVELVAEKNRRKSRNRLLSCQSAGKL
jgi:hypothetical protein